MLSRTADHLFWMARYMERAENTARMLDVNVQMLLLPRASGHTRQGWEGLLRISELEDDYARRYGELDAARVLDYMVRDPLNPSSILSCLHAARENARAMRGALSTEMWETQNQTWLEFNRQVAAGQIRRDPAGLFEWVKFRSHLSRGVTAGTMPHDEAFHFLRMGTFLERADNTARLLDVKLQGYAADPRLGDTATQDDPDFYHWSAVLRSLSAFEVYRKVYRDVIRPDRVAELMILRPDMPRSLAACVNEVVQNLRLMANPQAAEPLRRAGRLRADLQFGRIEEILATGLHAFLTRFLDRIGDVGRCVSRDLLVR